MSHQFSGEEREAVYQVIESRRDVRAFRPDPVPERTLQRILDAAHHAPSVGFMQPWNFIVVRDRATKARVHDAFLRENARAAEKFEGERGRLYRSLKLEGIMEAPVNLCVTCDRTRSGPNVLGRNTIFDTDVYSTACAIQNLWLAARAEGVGVGWVSIIRHEDLHQIFGIPEHVLPMAYLCIGYPREFLDEPELQRKGWAERVPLDELLYYERWGVRPAVDAA
ncbi:MAG: 5,6-dimethylbenzimidazole synthase [Candidatus Rokubacteria bacterium]|nr:5,6-dimethylbenzimidazole synthase [Candidatus Rokubacteria bacterium]